MYGLQHHGHKNGGRISYTMTSHCYNRNNIKDLYPGFSELIQLDHLLYEGLDKGKLDLFVYLGTNQPKVAGLGPILRILLYTKLYVHLAQGAF